MDETRESMSITREASSAPKSSPSHPSGFDDGGFTPGTLLLDRYRVVGLIGRGGMGEVYRAQDLKLGQTVALKFLPEALASDGSRLERFLNEVRMARQVSHPNVCRVFDVSELKGRPFLSMEFVDGEDLASLLRRIGRLPPDKGLEIARQICAGLAAAHDRGVLHRDLKPANILIDGRGIAHLADFGLASSAEELKERVEVAGTPAYMAPEQIEGREVTAQTDLFALGLVLFELFTGKRVFADASLKDLRETHRQRSSRASSFEGDTALDLQSGVELDPAVERVIERCLAPDPRKRPPSALAVAAALPGGDPLAAALAAGETPSPDLVAGASGEGAIEIRAALLLLGALAAGILASGWFFGKVSFIRTAPAMRSPDVLASRAEDLLDRIGLSSRADSAHGWTMDGVFFDYVRNTDQGADRWEKAAAADAPALRFWYRQSPAPLVPYDYSSDVSSVDPPLVASGMATVYLTPRGRLLSLAVAPPRRDAADEHGAVPDWSPLFAAAGVDPSALEAVTPREIPPVFATTRTAWLGTYPGRPDWAMRIEAAAIGPRPVFFDVQGPWQAEGAVERRGADLWEWIRNFIRIAVSIAALGLGLVMARRNARAGRTDPRNAIVIALCASLPVVAAFVVGTHRTWTLDEWPRFLIHLGYALYVGFQFWILYLALEPIVRRRWPHALISWVRLLQGRWRDPLVGRDVLVGVVGGVVVVVFGGITSMAPEWMGRPPISPNDGDNVLRALANTGSFLEALAVRPSRVLSEGLLILYLLLLSLIVFRSRWVAYLGLTTVFLGLGVNREAPVLSILGLVVLVTVVVFLISRFGLLSYMAAMFVLFTFNDLPVALDPTAWFAGRVVVTVLLLAGVAGWAFTIALPTARHT